MKRVARRFDSCSLTEAGAVLGGFNSHTEKSALVSNGHHIERIRMTEKETKRVYWKDCVKPDMYYSFIEHIITEYNDLIEELEELSIKRGNVEIYVPAEDIQEYIQRKKQ